MSRLKLFKTQRGVYSVSSWNNKAKLVVSILFERIFLDGYAGYKHTIRRTLFIENWATRIARIILIFMFFLLPFVASIYLLATQTI